MNVAIINYGMGNLASVQKAVEILGFAPFISDDPSSLDHCQRIILPGVGAFAEGMDRLAQADWVRAIHRAVANGTPILGICLGMQILADSGAEGGSRGGLGLIPGEIVSLEALGCDERVPHIGWNESRAKHSDMMFSGLPENSDFYFVHSFAFQARDPRDVVATTDYGCTITAAVRKGRVWGTQFHPEKSSKAGSRLLRNFIELAEC